MSATPHPIGIPYGTRPCLNPPLFPVILLWQWGIYHMKTPYAVFGASHITGVPASDAISCRFTFLVSRFSSSGSISALGCFLICHYPFVLGTSCTLFLTVGSSISGRPHLSQFLLICTHMTAWLCTTSTWGYILWYGSPPECLPIWRPAPPGIGQGSWVPSTLWIQCIDGKFFSLDFPRTRWVIDGFISKDLVCLCWVI